MNLFYSKNISSNAVHFDEEEVRHLNVLRKKIGDTLHITDGDGNYYETQIAYIDKRNCSANILKSTANANPLPYQLHLAIAPTKNIDRLEWCLEKATEIGISTITPLLCQNSERQNIRLDRLNGILLSAMKQSLQYQLPCLNPLTKFQDFIKQNEAGGAQKFIAYCNDEQLPHLSQITLEKKEIIVAIGPEGDFSEEEVSLAKKADFQGISLGKNRLRTETAGLFAVSIISSFFSK